MSIENEAIAENFRKAIEALNTKDIDALARRNPTRIGEYGYRTSAWCDYTHL